MVTRCPEYVIIPEYSTFGVTWDVYEILIGEIPQWVEGFSSKDAALEARAEYEADWLEDDTECAHSFVCEYCGEYEQMELWYRIFLIQHAGRNITSEDIQEMEELIQKGISYYGRMKTNEALDELTRLSEEMGLYE